MTAESRARTQALNNLFDEAFEEIDPAEESPLYGQLCSLEERYGQAEVIAVGGMKRILKVLDRHGNRHVAMARLHEDASDLLFEPFIREARLTALLEHPNIISVHDVGVDEEGQPYFTMDLKVGHGLDAVLQKALAGEGSPQAQNAEELLMLADGNGEFTAALGLGLDASGFGMGQRSQRFSMVVEDGVVTRLNVEAGPGVDVSSAEKILDQL